MTTLAVDWDSIAKIPKIHLHCHLEGTLRRSTLAELACKAGLWDPAEAQRLQNANYAVKSFPQFIEAFALACSALAKPEDYQRLALEFVQDAIAQNVVYGEIFVAPALWKGVNRQLDVRAALSEITSVFAGAKAQGVELRLIFGTSRGMGAVRAMDVCKLAVEMQESGVVAVGLGGSERAAACRDFSAAFEHARNHGLHVVAHAGEHSNAQDVRNAIDDIGAERIGHGIRSLDDAGLIELLRKNAIPLEVCPTSNSATGAVPPMAEHPIVELHKAGVRVIVDADDPAIFDTSITREYALVAELLRVRRPLRASA